jgi:hypothetical protein
MGRNRQDILCPKKKEMVLKRGQNVLELQRFGEVWNWHD